MSMTSGLGHAKNVTATVTVGKSVSLTWTREEKRGEKETPVTGSLVFAHFLAGLDEYRQEEVNEFLRAAANGDEAPRLMLRDWCVEHGCSPDVAAAAVQNAKVEMRPIFDQIRCVRTYTIGDWCVCAYSGYYPLEGRIVGITEKSVLCEEEHANGGKRQRRRMPIAKFVQYNQSYSRDGMRAYKDDLAMNH